MDFRQTDEQRLIAETTRQIGKSFGLEYWRQLDEKKKFPSELWAALVDAGLTGAALPEEYGGSGLGMTEMAIIIEELAASGGGATVGQLFMIGPIFGGYSILRFGSEAMKTDFLPRIVKGEIIALGLTEPNAGSNSLAMETFAEKVDGGWRLNGAKMWITGMDQASKILVACRTIKAADAPKRTDGISMFLIDVKRQGLTFAPIEKMGTNTLTSSNVYFDNVLIEDHELIGRLHGGWHQLVEILNSERIATTAALVGTGRLGVQLGVDYAKERRVFDGKPIGSYQGLQFPIAQAFIELEAARLLNFKSSWLFDQGEPAGAEANAAKLIAARAAELAVDRAMQVMGGMGYAKESHVERLWRDVRLFRIAPIAEEMVLNFVAVHNLGLPRSY
ncbi:MAG: acyl-CoA dehydrogenase family protein [Caulobacterales bacterium]